jgi:hypothetical protein
VVSIAINNLLSNLNFLLAKMDKPASSEGRMADYEKQEPTAQELPSNPNQSEWT